MHKIEIGHGESCCEWMKDLPEERIFDPENRPAIIIGMNVRPFQEVMIRDIRNSLISAGLVFLLALSEVGSLFWAQHYMNSRKLLQDIRAFASEIVRNLPVGMVVVSGDGKIIFINGVACSLLAIRPESAEGSLARSILPTSLFELRNSITRGKTVVEKELNLTGRRI